MQELPVKQFSKVDNPISVEVPIERPSTEPIVVEVMKDVKFDHAHPPVAKEISLPEGNWEKVILVITGDQIGRQYDRIMHIWAGSTQIFAGCTPEPTRFGIEWKVEKDITIYKPVLKGTQLFTMQLDNYMDHLHDGIPNMSFYLEFYPAQTEKVEQKAWELQVPDTIIPILKEPKPYLLEKDHTMEVTLTLPNDIKELYLDLYVIHQNRDEFYWYLTPAFREVEIYIDDQPAGVVWPDPILYTGGVNPLFYQPITGLRCMNLPTFLLNLTPFAGMLDGEHTFKIRVENNENYWLLGGSLFLYQNNGQPTKGKIIKNTLEFPRKSYLTEKDVLDSETDKLYTEEAALQYEIVGEIETEEGTFTATVNSKLQYSNDKSEIRSTGWGMVHGAQSIITDETIHKGEEIIKHAHRESTYSLDCTSTYIRDKEKKGISMNSNLSQTFTDVYDFTSKELEKPYTSNLQMNSQAYAVLQRVNEVSNASHANTSAHIVFHDSEDKYYQQTLMTRGGVVTYKHEIRNK